MIKEARIAKEISVKAANRVGVLADMSRLISGCGINLEAVAGYALHGAAKIMLVTEDNRRAIQILKAAGYKSIKENEVVIVALENKPGVLNCIAEDLAAQKIDIKQIYGSTYSAGHPSKLVLSTSNNRKALAVLKR